MVKVYKATDVGLVRETNEDSFIEILPNTYIVADGMGGHAAGEVASRLLIQTMKDGLQQNTLEYSEDLLKNMVSKANAVIWQQAAAHPEYAGMGTTATVFHREENCGIWAHVGDSRLYLLRQGSLQQVTQDHSLVEDLVRNGSITEEQARIHPRKNVLTRAVGVDSTVNIDTGTFPVEARDTVLLCTDGLTNMMSDAEIQEILAGDTEDPAACLVKKALDAGGSDNITAIVVKYDEE